MSLKCPYCQKELTKIPKRKTECFHCNKFIYVRNRIPMTKSLAIAIDFKKNLENSDVGFTEERYIKFKEELTKKSGFRRSENDMLWVFANQLLMEAMGIGDWQKLKMLYLAMAMHIYDEGGDCFKSLQIVRECELKYFQQMGCKKVKIVTCGNSSCPACQKYEGKVLSIEEALRNMPLPVKDCSFKLNQKASHTWCRCCYFFIEE